MLAVSGCGLNNDSGDAYQKGILTDVGFESEFLGLRFETPADFIMATEEELAASIETGKDAMTLSEAQIDYAELTSVYEMMVASPTGSPNIIVAVEKLPLSNISEEQYFDSLKTILPNQTALTYFFDDAVIEDVTLAGQAYKALILDATANGMEIKQEYIIRRIGNRMLALIVTYTADTEDAKNSLLECFTAY